MHMEKTFIGRQVLPGDAVVTQLIKSKDNFDPKYGGFCGDVPVNTLVSCCRKHKEWQSPRLVPRQTSQRSLLQQVGFK